MFFGVVLAEVIGLTAGGDGVALPLLATQILWINLVSEGTLTVNLVMEKAEGDELDGPPVANERSLFNAPMLRRMLLMVLASVTVTFGFFVWRLHSGVDFAIVQSETFTLLIVCQWFNILNCRSARKSAISLDLIRNPWLLGGLVVTEQVFNLNGLGLLFVQAIARRDYTLTQALVLLVASVFILVNFLMDVMYAWIDPRIRHR